MMSSPLFFSSLPTKSLQLLLYLFSFKCIFGHQLQLHHNTDPSLSQTVFGEEIDKIPFAIGRTKEGCDIFSGRWVWDESRPLYEESDCPFIYEKLICLQHGRPEKKYQHWRWQPHNCDLPRFNNTLMLETLRGKRMLFVGDSVIQGQFYSLVCLIHSLIPDQQAKSMENINDSLTLFTAKDYNATIGFYWAPFLLESNSDHNFTLQLSERIVRKGSIDTHGDHWKGVDLIVFDTYLWWLTGMDMKILQSGSFDDKIKDIVELSTEDAYRMALKSMLEWVQINMDPKMTRVFFVSMSATHFKSIDWGGEPGRNCYNETTMIEDPNYWGSDCRKSLMQVLGEELSDSNFLITLLNITQLTSYRKDAHPGIYRKFFGPLPPDVPTNPMKYADCIHWCLPGVQDNWNELFFTKLFYP